MTRIRLAILAFAMSLSPASALAALLRVHAQVQYRIYGLAPVTLTGSGIGSSVGGGGATIPAGIFSGNPALVAPISPTFIGIGLVSVPADSIANPAGSFGPNGAMGIAGSVVLPDFDDSGIPLFQVGGGDVPFTNNVRLGVLIGDLQGATWMGGEAVFAWTGAAALAIAITVRATAYDNRTAAGQGTVQLVAPARVQTGVFGPYPVFGILTLTYTPEPGTLTLLGAGVAALAALGQRKRSRT